MSPQRRRLPKELEGLVGARKFGHIYKPRYATGVVCAGAVRVKDDGSWTCLKCGAAPKGKREASAGTQHNEMKESAYWWVSYRHEGKRHAVSSKSTKVEDAEQLRWKIFADLWSGQLPWVKREGPTLGELLALVVANYEKNKRRSIGWVKRRVERLKEFKPFEGGRIRAAKVTEQLADDYVVFRQGQDDANSTINRDLVVLRRAYRLAAKRTDEEGRPLVARVLSVELLEEAPPREGFFEPHEFAAVHRALQAGHRNSSPAVVADIAELYYFTGWRKTDVLELQWSQVNFFRRTITLRRALNKAGEPWELPFEDGDAIGKLLRRARKRTEETEARLERKIPHVFHRSLGQPVRGFRGAWAKACKRAGLTEPRTPHDFRRTAARDQMEAHADPQLACDLVGWKSGSKMLERYRIVRPGDRAAAMRKRMDLEGDREKARQLALQFEKKQSGGEG